MQLATSQYVSARCVRGLLRLLSAREGLAEFSSLGAQSSFRPNDIVDAADLEFLWAISRESRQFVADLLNGRLGQIHRSLTGVPMESIGQIDGAIDARATILLQACTGDDSRFVTEAQVRTSINAKNLLLLHVLWHLHKALSRAAQLRQKSVWSEFLEKQSSAVNHLVTAPVLFDCYSTSAHLRSPDGRARRLCRTASSNVYRTALRVLELREGLARGDEGAYSRVVVGALLPAIEDWRRFELSSALSIIDRLSAVSGEQAVLGSVFDPGKPLARVGRLSVYWQQKVLPVSDSRLSGDDRKAREIYALYNITDAADRSDICIKVDDQHILSVVECKFFESPEYWRSRLAEGIAQMVRYCRQLSLDDSAMEKLLSCSMVVLAGLPESTARFSVAHRLPACDLQALDKESADGWATALFKLASLHPVLSTSSIV